MKPVIEIINGIRYLNGCRYVGTSNRYIFNQLLKINEKAPKLKKTEIRFK